MGRLSSAQSAGADLAPTVDYALRVLLAVASQDGDASALSPIEAALCRQHLADVVESLLSWCQGPQQEMADAGEIWPGLLPAPVARRLWARHHAEGAAYRVALEHLCSQLRAGPLAAISLEGWALCAEIAQVLADQGDDDPAPPALAART